MMNKDYLDDFICGPTCEEYYDEDWVGWDDDYDHLVQRNRDIQSSINLNSWSNW